MLHRLRLHTGQKSNLIHRLLLSTEVQSDILHNQTNHTNSRLQLQPTDREVSTKIHTVSVSADPRPRPRPPRFTITDGVFLRLLLDLRLDATRGSIPWTFSSSSMTGARRAGRCSACAQQSGGRQGGGVLVQVLLRAPCDAQAQGRRGRRAAGSSRKGGGRRLGLGSKGKGRRPSEENESPSVTFFP